MSGLPRCGNTKYEVDFKNGSVPFFVEKGKIRVVVVSKDAIGDAESNADDKKEGTDKAAMVVEEEEAKKSDDNNEEIWL